ncbi:MAG TPA: class I SAM-dependent methyltransferase [Burkholderiales bacterium]|nr:class I SAM-dependent methyltransferase [Burkholderiales bacterium]
MRNYFWLDSFLDALSGDVYAEVPAEPHLSITRSVIERLHAEGRIHAGERVLDVGCGQGLALEHFRRLGLQATGITLGPDVAACRAKGFEVLEMDQNFMDFDDESFDLLWCRHVLEHSVAPFFTLSEYRRLTKRAGLIYVEVPAPDTACHHESNPNHYSVLPRSAWASLFGRIGLGLELHLEHNFVVPAGPDTYWGFLLRRTP